MFSYISGWIYGGKECSIPDSTKFRVNDEFCDITLQSADKILVRAHKNILIAASDFFKNTFSSGTQECYEYEQIKGDVLEKVISYIYTKTLEANDAEKIEEIAICAKYFQLDKLIDKCMQLLKNYLCDENCLKYWRLSQEYFHTDFEDQCITHVLNSPERFYEKESFLIELNVAEIQTLLKDIRLDWSEEKKLKIILHWIKEKTQTEEEFQTSFDNFIDFIDFASKSKELLPNILTNDDLLKHKNLLNIIAQKTLERPRQFFERKKILALIGNDVVMVSNDGNFTTIHRKERRFFRTGHTQFKNFMFSCGGMRLNEEHYNCVDICEYFDPHKKEWCYLPSMLSSRRCHSCAFLEDKIYVCSGWNRGLIKTVEILDINEERWSKGKDMSFGRIYFGLTPINRALYAVGGCGDNLENSNKQFGLTVEMFDPRASNPWKIVHKEVGYSSATECISVDNDIYISAFSNKKRKIFDTKMNKMRNWEITPHSLLPTFGNVMRFCLLNGNLIFLQRNYKDPDTSYINFYKCDLEGNLLCSKPKCLHVNKEILRALSVVEF